MKISILCSDSRHPVNSYLERWMAQYQVEHDVELARTKEQLSGGDLLFLISCSEIVRSEIRGQYQRTLVLHASPLPQGRGWSPHIWAILEGAEELTLSLLEAEDKVDSGRIWDQKTFKVAKNALCDEINHALFEAELDLMSFAVDRFYTVQPKVQSTEVAASYYPRRSPEDSRVDPDKSIVSQFDIIRVSDPLRYPAYFDLYGHRYKITLEKI